MLSMKKVLLVFDTSFGNTEKIARSIASGISESNEIECNVIGIKQMENEDISGYAGVLFGCPIHAFRATRGIKGAVNTAIKKGLDGKLVAAFDTYQALSHERKAMGQIEDMLTKKAQGAKLFSPGFSALVLGREGPLRDDEPDNAKEFGRAFAEELQNW